MAAGGARPAGDPPVRAEVLCKSERTRVTRLFCAGRTVIRKEPLGPDAQRRLQHELAMLERLRGVAGVAQLVDAPRYPGSIVLADAGATSLAGVVKPLAVDDLIGLAVELAGAVAGMHRQGVMHRDITPANIVIASDGAPCLADFALATSFAEIRPEFTHHTQIVGTLAYLAPEQTGRTGRSVDQRADLYALGATLYELATGRPPFDTGDPLRLTHDHLARVPAPPAEVNPAIPAPLSEIILHLLEKEPDNRYQTAEGVLYDLERVRDAQVGPAAAPRIGEHDVPLRLLPPSRLVGRDGEVAALQAASADMLAGRCRAVLVSGAPGVGKTALIDELRPVVTANDGWFVVGKFDQYRRDLEFDAVYQAFRALGRLLLAEPEDELAQVRERIVGALGRNAGLLAAAVPEFAALLAVPPDPGDPLTRQVRLQRAAMHVLRTVGSRKRPVVLFVDDLQWAGRTPVGFVDLVLSEEPVDGLLLVAAYREDDTDPNIDSAHPLAAPLSRWRDQPGVQHLRLDNLPVSGSVSMVAEMLHADRATAASLVEVIEPHTHGNPYETVELLNALRGDGSVTATAAGWRWDEAAVGAHLGRSEIAGLPAARVHAMPARSRQMVEAMACLGGRAEVDVLQTATGEPGDVVEQRLAPALDEDLLVVEPGAHEAVRFRHDRIREVILRGVDPQRRRALQLAMARRLAQVPELFAVAAEQYLPVVDAIDDTTERHRVVGLLRRAADQAAVIGDYGLVNALLAAALRLIDPGEAATLIEMRTGRHAALYDLGRLDEADEEYHTIERLCPTALDRADATVVQVRSLTHRSRFAEAIFLGLGSLRELGITVPAADRLPMELDHQFDYLYRWLDHTETADDPARDITDPTLLAATRLLSAVLPAVYYIADHAMYAWLSLEVLRIWLAHGPGRTLVGPAGVAAFAAVALRGDYAAGYRAMRQVLALGEARGYEPDTSHARFMFALGCCWFEPIENGVQAAGRALEGLIAGGDLANAGYAYSPAVFYLLDCAPSLDVYVAEVQAGLALVQRTGSEQTGQRLDPYRWLAGVLRGESSTAAGEAVPIDRNVDNPLALLHAHIARAIAAAIFGDLAGLARHAAAAMPLQPAALGLYPTAVARLLRGLALAGQARISHSDERGALLSELDEATRWLAARASDAPDNFLHLQRLLEAERAWAIGDFPAAALAFDAARREAAQRQRPWHRALITERAARFFLAHGLEHAGYDLLAQARREYLAWGATAKVDQLDWAYPALRPQADATAEDRADQPAYPPHGRGAVTTGTLDLLGILSASQALSSETSIERLHARVAQVLNAMTGATGVHLLLWGNDRNDWVLPAPGSDGGAVPVNGTGHEQAIPMSVLRYAQRTREPLVVSDATGDDRFARDPYFADVDCCSLLAVPILNRDTLRAVLLLENRLLRGAFTADRLDAVKLITGQLAVSLDNAQLYAESRRFADEQAALRRVATLVARAAAPEEVFAAVVAELGRLLPVELTQLNRYDPDGAATKVVGAWARTGAAVPFPVGTRMSLGGQNVGTLVMETGRAARIDDYTDAGGVISAATRERGVRSSVGVPISVEGRLWGHMSVASTQEQRFPADIEARLAGFAEMVATAIANAHARLELRGFAAEQAALRRVATLVACAAPPEEVFAAVTEEVGRLLDVDFTIMNRYDQDSGATLLGSWSKTGTVPAPVGSRLELGGRNVTTLVLHTRRPARVEPYGADAGPAPASALGAGLRSGVGAPISVEGRLWGVIVVGSRREEPLPADTEARLAGFTELVATAIANVQARVELRGHADEQAALRRVATVVARAAPPERVFAAVTAEVGQLLSVEFTFLSRYDGDSEATVVLRGAWTSTGAPSPVPVGKRMTFEGRNVTALVFQTRRPARIDRHGEDAGQSPAAPIAAGLRSAVGVPISVEGRLWGVMIAGSTLEPLPADTEARLTGFTELVATAIANAESQAQLTSSRARIVAAADQTRRRIERDLHDGAQHRLVSLALQLQAAQAAVPLELGELGAELDIAVEEATGALAELRELARGIHPAILAEGGLPPALKTLARRCTVPVELDVRVDRRPTEPIEIAAYYLVAEALTNAAKHAHASTVHVEVDSTDSVLRVCVRDDGRGGADLAGGSGLVGLKDRAEALGGRLWLHTAPGAGTTIRAELPLGPARAISG
jgi:GAF domain-containing protein